MPEEESLPKDSSRGGIEGAFVRGASVGIFVGEAVGALESTEGSFVGLVVGEFVAVAVGEFVGVTEGDFVGLKVEAFVGSPVGSLVGGLEGD